MIYQAGWRRLGVFALWIVVSLLASGSARAVTRGTRKTHSHRDLKRKAAWTGAGVAAGHFAGPAGSLGVGVLSHRRQLQAGGDARNRALVKIGAPLAAGAAFGPAGTVGYEAVDHRKWIRDHILTRHHRKAKYRHSRRPRR
jgi:hypothetical protein